MAYLGVEEIADLIVTSIKASINTKITAINLEHSDTIAETIDTDRYAINELGVIEFMPFIQVVPEQTEIEVPGGAKDCGWATERNNFIIKAHNISDDGTIEQCAKRSYRYARAISEIILADRTLSDNVLAWYRNTVDYTPIMSNLDQSAFKQEIWINTTVLYVNQEA
jgi:hypothetical protein